MPSSLASLADHPMATAGVGEPAQALLASLAPDRMLISPMFANLAPRLADFSRARAHLLGAALIGALLMVLADWLGHQLLFPAEIPAGLVASLLGGAYFMWASGADDRARAGLAIELAGH